MKSNNNTSKESKNKKGLTPEQKKYITWIWAFAGIFILLTVMLFMLIAYGKIGYMPPIEELQNPKNKYATEVYSEDQKLLGCYFLSKENRINVNYAQISPNVIHALIATEDARFMEHSGIDGWALCRAIILRGIFRHKSAGGGSTITQQLAKQLWSGQAPNAFQRMMQKPIEWTIAVQLEKYYTKEEIITMYLNQFDFLYNAVGIKTAAQVYFSTTPDKLTIEQAATLIGMCKNPMMFNPLIHPERALERRNVVMDQMRKADYLTQEQYNELCKKPLGVHFQMVDHKTGLAPYFREYLRIMLTAKRPDKSDYTDSQQTEYHDDSLAWETNPVYGFCEKTRKPDGSKYNIYTDGLKIYTTIDSRMQQYAEEAVDEHIQELQRDFYNEKKGQRNAPFSNSMTQAQIDASMEKSVVQSDRYQSMKRNGSSDAEIHEVFHTKIPMQVFTYKGLRDTLMSPIDSIRYHKYFLRCGFMSMNPFNGHVKAYVGGPNFAQFQYDMVSLGRRQVGSTIKPFLYTLAMEEGRTPCDEVVNKPYTLTTGTGEKWTPRNSNNKQYGETVTLQWGLANSNNWISAYLMSQFTPTALVKIMRSFGIQGPIDPVVSLCLGPAEIKLSEMVDAYTTFVNQGLRVEPLYVTRIEDNTGNVIATFTPKMKEIINANTAYKMIYMLKGVVDYGTAHRLRSRFGLRGEICGKTGTTQNNSDGWFIGFTPSLVSGAWIGGEDRGIHFDSMHLGQGANTALPIWALFMQKVYADQTLGYTQADKFVMPQNMKVINGCLKDNVPAKTEDIIEE